MKVIIAGSRTVKDIEMVKAAIKKSGFDITEVVSGTAHGVDELGEQWAKENNIPVKRFPANWDTYGRSAGYIRNKEMASYVSPEGALIAVWDGKSNGTMHMINIATSIGLKKHVHKG